MTRNPGIDMKKFGSGIWSLLRDYGLITLGLTLYVIGWSVFLVPQNMIGGGVSGIGAIVQYATGFPMGYTYALINIILLLIALKVLGGGFGFKTVYAILLTGFLLRVMPGLIPSSFVQDFALANGPMLCTVIGGVFSGIGIGFSMNAGGSTGGTDIIALMVSKYKPISPGRMILLMDVFIIGFSLLIPSFDVNGVELCFSDKLAKCIYGFILITVCGYTVDLFIAGTQQSVQAFIFSKDAEAIADALAFDMKRGVTVIPAKGWYTKNDVSIVMVVTRKSDLNLLLKYVKTIDPEAFLSVGSTMGVYGKGFEEIKVKSIRPSETTKKVN